MSRGPDWQNIGSPSRGPSAHEIPAKLPDFWLAWARLVSGFVAECDIVPQLLGLDRDGVLVGFPGRCKLCQVVYLAASGDGKPGGNLILFLFAGTEFNRGRRT